MSTFNRNNLRYNPFTQAFTAYGYGKGGNDKEVKTVPTSSPYWIYLDEIPREDTPSTVAINEQGGSTFTEVSFSTSPAASQYRVCYGGDGTTTQTTAGQGIVEFNSADAGKIMEIAYYGLGDIMQNQFIKNHFGDPIYALNEIPDYFYDSSLSLLSEQDTPDMTVKVSAGEGICNGQYVRWAETNLTFTAPGSNTRLDYIVVDYADVETDGVTVTPEIVAGTAAASPDFPSVTANQLILGCVVLKAATASLNDGQEIFIFRNGNDPYFPNLYINAAYTATNKSHNNVIVDMSNAVITGTLECQGNCWVVDYDNTGTDGSSNSEVLTSPGQYKDGDEYTLNSLVDTLVGSGGDGLGNPQVAKINRRDAGSNANNITIEAFNIYVYDITLSGGNAYTGSISGYDQNDADASYPNGHFYIGGCGGAGANGGNVTLEAINEIELLTGGTVDLTGGDGSNGEDESTGSVGNLGGYGGDGGDGGDLTMTAVTITENGTLTQTAGSAGSAGTGSGGSDNNGNGSAGSAGSAGSKTSTTYDFTTGLPDGYADWVHALYKDNEK